MERLRIEDLDFKFRLTGKEGPLLVLLHGYGGGPLDWHHFLPYLENQHRVLVPNLHPLFSCESPIGFSKQVQILAKLVDHVNAARDPFVLIGTSYGGTLSFGLRANFQSLVMGHVMMNPMPLDPLSFLKSSQLRMLFGLNMVPGALPLFLKTKMGRALLIELGDAFGFGVEGRKGLQELSERKLMLISKAVQRFAWIAQHEDWSYWSNQLRDHLIPLLLFNGAKDPLFDEKDFRSFQNVVPLSEHYRVENGAHLMIKDHAPQLAQKIVEFVASLEHEPTLTPTSLKHAI